MGSELEKIKIRLFEIYISQINRKIEEYNNILYVDSSTLILSICIVLILIFAISIIIWLNINSVVKKKVEKCNRYKKSQNKRKNPLNNNVTDGLLAKYFML